jgi:hypothetical protein
MRGTGECLAAENDCRVKLLKKIWVDTAAFMLAAAFLY